MARGDGSRSSALSLGTNNSKRYGCTKPIKVMDAEATPGVLAKMSTHKPRKKLQRRADQRGWFLRKCSTKIT